LIIIDDKSSDNSVRVISEWVEKTGFACTFIAHQQNCGLCATLNEALKLCEGEYLQAIACDDVLVTDKFAIQVSALQEDPKSALACSDFSTINGSSEMLENKHYAKDYQFPTDPFIAILDGSAGYKRVIHSPTALVRKTVIEEIGGWPEDLIQEDFYMWLQITFRYPVIFNNIALVKYRFLESSLSSSLTSGSTMTKRYYQDQIKVMELFLQKAQGKRSEVLIVEILKCIEKLEHYFIRNCKDSVHLQEALVKWLNYRMNLLDRNRFKTHVEKSLGKTIYHLWVAGHPGLPIYKHYQSDVAMKYRIPLILGTKYSSIQKLKALMGKQVSQG
jgi:glycosyltransferase involved in cell wall biosynthesis